MSLNISQLYEMLTRFSLMLSGVVTISVLKEVNSAGLPLVGVTNTLHSINGSNNTPVYTFNDNNNINMLNAANNDPTSSVFRVVRGFSHPVQEIRAPFVALANLEPGSDEGVQGEVIFTQFHPHGPVFIEGNITGLRQGSHGLHVHTYGDRRNDCDSAGEHYNPYGLQHGAPLDGFRHVGDLGNIEADESGAAEFHIADPLITLHGGPQSVVGRMLVVHADKDDLGRGGTVDSITTGTSGTRLACGIIGLIH